MADGVDVGTAYVSVVPRLDRSALSSITSHLGSIDATKAGSKIGSGLGRSIGANLDLSSVGDKLIKAGDGLSKVGDTLTSHVTAPLVAAGAAAGAFALHTASAAETTQVSFTTMLGSEQAALEMMETLSDFAAHTPFELSGLQTATRQLLAYGFTAQDVIPMLTAVGDATAALGTGQAGIEGVTRALGQMQTRGKVSAEEMLQLTEQGIPAWEYLAEAIGTDTAGAMDAVSKGAVDANTGIQALVSGMERDFGGMMEEQSKTVEGLFSNLSDAIEQPLMKLRDSSAYEHFADALSEVVDSAGPFVESLLPHMERGLDTVADVLGMASDAMDSFAGMSESAQGDLIGLVTQLALAGPTAKVAGVGLKGLGTAVKGAGSLLSAGGKIVSKLSDGLLDLATSPKTAGTAIGGLAGAISSIPTPATVAIGVVGGLAAVIGGALAAESAEAAEHQRLLEEATASASDIMSGAVSSADGLGDAIGGISVDAEETLQSLADLNASVSDTLGDVEVDSARLDQYVAVIGELANQSNLTATQQYRLKEAVEGYNDIVGTQYSVTDEVNGVISDQNGIIQESTDQILDNAEAWKQKARSEALSSVAAEYMEAEYKALYELQAAQEQLTAAQNEYNDVVDRMNSMSDKTSDEFYELGRRAEELNNQINGSDGLKQSVSDLSASYDSAAEKADGLSSAAAIQEAVFDVLGDKALDFTASLSSMGVSLEDFSKLTDNQMDAIASAWDGSAESVIDAMRELGVEVPDSAYAAMTASSDAAASIKSALSDMAYSGSVDSDVLAGALASVGVSSQQMRAVGSENMNALSQAVGGDVDAMVYAVQHWNELPFLSKDGDVTVEDGSLVDAQGNVWTWNGTEFVSKSASATVGGNIDYGLDRAYEWQRLPRNLGDKFASITTTINNITNNVTRFINGHASGGIRLHAKGGIAIDATPLDIVGEAGAEAIVPLTNRRYSQPFADIIAEGVSKKMGDSQGRSRTTVYNISIDGASLSSTPQLLEAFEAFMGALSRTYGMGAA